MIGSAAVFMYSVGPRGEWTRVLTFGAASGSIVAGLIALRDRRTMPQIFERLGDASYALYLIHMPMLLFVWNYLPNGHNFRFFFHHLEVGAVAIVIASLVASVGYHKWIELPLIAASRRSVTMMRYWKIAPWNGLP